MAVDPGVHAGKGNWQNLIALVDVKRRENSSFRAAKIQDLIR